jgi:hypothetical protein
MRQFLAVIALMIAGPAMAMAAPTAQQLVVGTWSNDADAKALVQMKAGGTWIDSRTDNPGAASKSAWRLFFGAHPPKAFPTGETLSAKGAYIEVNDFGGEYRFYGLDLVTAKTLHLTDLSDSSKLTYTRVKAAAAARKP